MPEALERLLDRRGGVVTRAEALRICSRSEFDQLVRRGLLVAPFPRAYVAAWQAELPSVRVRAAVGSVGAPCAVSHDTALRLWQHVAPDGRTIHLTVPARRRVVGGAGLVVHRTSQVPALARRDGLPVVTPAEAVVGCWSAYPPASRRTPVIEACREGLVTLAALRALVERRRRLPGRIELRELLTLLADGCESELEIWGFMHVFAGPEFAHGVRQFPVAAGGRRYRFDLAFEPERVAVELDGRAFHASVQQWERDIARDLALAAVGWQTVRLSHDRLTRDPDGCRRAVLRVLALRRAA